MKKTLLPLLLLVPLLGGCKGWPEANADVKELRQLHAIYRENTVPKSATESAKVEKLAGKIDSILAHMEELTR